jgi:hypothetical protein
LLEGRSPLPVSATCLNQARVLPSSFLPATYVFNPMDNAPPATYNRESQDYLLGYFQPSLAGLVRSFDPTQHWRTGLLSAVPAGLSKSLGTAPTALGVVAHWAPSPTVCG